MAQDNAIASGVVDMLKEDHTKVKELFEQFESAEGRERGQIAATAIQELEIHAALEEKLIYPAIREEIDEDDLMNEAVEEHHVVHLLIRELKKLKASDPTFQAKFMVLSELVKHHIEEEEGSVLPKAEESDIDWQSLEEMVLKRREALMSKASSGGRNARSSSNRRSKSKK